ncbi:hypothetical protein TWF694_001751 [Orbilia ellipsospora]|uniref:Genetic interactor of prohibitins 3, mitochondrial n=1 Tax=Orbilia ellipsospora TaxID=2528407 RepID=A0AAV9X3Q7_9PEZI
MLARRAVARWHAHIGSRHLSSSRWLHSSPKQYLPFKFNACSFKSQSWELHTPKSVIMVGKTRWYSTLEGGKEDQAESDASHSLEVEETMGITEEQSKVEELEEEFKLRETEEYDINEAKEVEIEEEESFTSSNERPEALVYRDPTSIPSGPVAYSIPLPERPDDKMLPTGLPEFCPGCGAKSHNDIEFWAGYYGAEARMPSPKSGTKYADNINKRIKLDRVYAASLGKMSDEIKELMRQANMHPPSDAEEQQLSSKYDQEGEKDDMVAFENIPPRDSAETESWFEALEIEPLDKDDHDRPKILCARCRNLLHHDKKLSDTPDATFTQAAEVIAQSPFNRVHVYHLIDAADFPVSVLPNARRAILKNLKGSKKGGRKDVTMSYVITRADLLMPTEQKVTSLMTYIRRVLTNYLGEETDLKDLRVVSAKRTWTTERLKDEIRARKGGVVLLGKTNVGKSRLYEAIFPKRNAKDFPMTKGRGFGKEEEEEEEEWYVQNGQKVKYPDMPLASKVPGTTVGPITIDFAAGRGQLVDLPGFSRGGMMNYVKQDYVKDVLMLNKINPTKDIVLPGQSYLLGGLVRVLPLENMTGRPVTLEVATFSNLPPHVASHNKAHKYLYIEKGSGKRPFIWAKPGIGESVQSAGTYTLTDDITKRRAERLVRAMGEEAFEKNAPFKIYATDIVIEGIGWLEVSAQVGKNDPYPEIEVWSPNGKGIYQRETMKAYEESIKPGPKAAPGSRPRKSMKGAKKAERAEKYGKRPERADGDSVVRRVVADPRVEGQ